LKAEDTFASWAAVSDRRPQSINSAIVVAFRKGYDLAQLKLDDAISATGDFQEAWFRDPEGNILRIHSWAEI